MKEAMLLELAMEHQKAGRLDQAGPLYARILETQPDHVDALHLLGTVAYERGSDRLALELLRRAITLVEPRPEPHYHLGLVLVRLGNLPEAQRHFARAVELSPGFALAHQQLGLVYQRQGQQEAAATCFQTVLALEPSLPGAANRLAETLCALGRGPEAIASLQNAVERLPSGAHLRCALADVYHALGQLPRAVTCYREAVALDANLVQAWWGLGCAESALGDLAAARDSLGQVVRLAPDSGEAHHNLGKAFFGVGQIDQALQSFEMAAARLKNPELPLAMIATVIPGSSRADQQAVLLARKTWANRCAPCQPSRTSSRKPGPFRVGYVSAYFKDRNWMKPVWGLVNSHDRAQWAVHLFSDGPASSIHDGYRRDERDGFHDVSRLSNAELAQRIQQQDIDILVDLNGYSRVSRLPLFALRPAPVCVAWFNMFATSGMDCFDYLIGDQHVHAAEEDANYSERVVRLPVCYLTFEVTYPVPDVTLPPCLERGFLTFGCLAPQYKITTEVIEAWSQILHGCPSSRLVLKNVALGSAGTRRFVRDLFARFGIAPERVDLEGPAEHYVFLEKYRDIDVALDTFPYNGGTTTMEALWQGVPVLTFHGDRWASRISASLLRHALLPEYVAPDRQGYVAQAIELASHRQTPARLEGERRTFRERLRQTPVCDVRTFTYEMEQAYQRMLLSGQDGGKGR